MECEHKWVFQGSDYKEQQVGAIKYEVTRIDTYYCENCLERREVISKSEIVRIGDPYPYWFKR